jgi:hypothetical protein
MNPSDVAGAFAGLVILGAGAAGGWGVSAMLHRGRCSCGHGGGCLDRFTGNCTATVLQRNYVSGVHRSWKRVPCPCKEHGPRTEMKAITP